MILILLLVGLCIGSFLNVLIDRLPKGLDVIHGRSHCDYCKKTLRWFELIPVLSFLVQRGRCRRCHKKLFWQYPIIELSTGVLFGVVGSMSPTPLTLAGNLVVSSAFLVIFVADLKEQIIPDSMLVAAAIGLLPYLATLSRADLINHGLTAAITALAFYLLYEGTRRRGMGFGDVKLAAVLGLLLGFPNTVISLYVAFISGALVGIVLLAFHRARMKSHIAFGPFLIIGIVAALLWGNQIIGFWLRLI